MRKLYEVARVFRSKNASPFVLTIDILFDSGNDYRTVLNSDIITKKRVAELYNISQKEVNIIPFHEAQAIKITLPRLVSSGSLGDRDVYGAQQHGPLLELVI
jgi:hypothetical protein